MPVMPAAAKQNTPDGAAAFARHYVGVLNYAWQKPDETPLRALGLPGCRSCDALSNEAKRLARAGERLDRAAVIVGTSDPGYVDPEGSQTVIISGTQTAARTLNAAGRQTAVATEKKFVAQYSLHYESGGWLVRTIKTGSN